MSMSKRMSSRFVRSAALLCSVGLALLSLASPSAARSGSASVNDTAARPDLTGTYNAATITPLVRPRAFGDNLYMAPEEAEKLMREAREFSETASLPSDPNRSAPQEGGAAPIGFDDEQRETLGAGNVGGYNWFWVDRGEEAFTVDGKFRTSIIVDPPNGRHPPMTEAALERLAERRKLRRPNDGTAWWLDVEGPGPYDGPESLGIPERCLLGFTGVAPMLPGLYNNYKTITQTEDHVMILVEMVHDARVVRLNSEHPPADQRFWLGDSIGWWEGDTLVVDTTNFRPDSRQAGASENLHVVERFSLQDDGNLLYRFTVEDPTVWTEPWSGEYVWRRSGEKVYEYACHEGNYAMEGILKGARLLEREARQKQSGDTDD